MTDTDPFHPEDCLFVKYVLNGYPWWVARAAADHRINPARLAEYQHHLWDENREPYDRDLPGPGVTFRVLLEAVTNGCYPHMYIRARRNGVHHEFAADPRFYRIPFSEMNATKACHRFGIVLSELLEVPSGEISRYVRARRAGYGHDDLVAAHRAGYPFDVYWKARRAGCDHTELMTVAADPFVNHVLYATARTNSAQPGAARRTAEVTR